jgi:hypothetical protein
MLQVLLPLHEKMEREGPSTLKEIAFVQVRGWNLGWLAFSKGVASAWKGEAGGWSALGRQFGLAAVICKILSLGAVACHVLLALQASCYHAAMYTIILHETYGVELTEVGASATGELLSRCYVHYYPTRNVWC